MKKIEAYIKSDKLKEAIHELKKIGVPGFTYYAVTGHGREEEVKGFVPRGISAIPIKEDILPRTKIEIMCNDKDVDKIFEAIWKACCTKKPGDGMVFVSPITAAYKLKAKEKLSKLE
ncbi:P-II family nitrogen regulator [Candidatus Hecatella orcuttiae]|jgi:nitrogen regulatory protein P-II 1|uniref:P-II family nitrogen regulator n=1 Tax=Candidatus Hecatella orcuttiae TaxID=1935119 RepID=UPI002868346F|nr:P-II family nitrogen regulator [Candidatus Hecatella orcuttiae]